MKSAIISNLAYIPYGRSLKVTDETHSYSLMIVSSKLPDFCYFGCMSSKFTMLLLILFGKKGRYGRFSGDVFMHISTPRIKVLFTFLYVIYDTLYSSFKIILPISKSVICLHVLPVFEPVGIFETNSRFDVNKQEKQKLVPGTDCL